jgi:hypothetical protein
VNSLQSKFKEGRAELKLNNVPPAIEEKLTALISSIRSSRFSQPDGKPKGEWKLFLGGTWEDAENEAQDASYAIAHNPILNTKKAEGRMKAQAALESIDRDLNLDAVYKAVHEAVWDSVENAKANGWADDCWVGRLISNQGIDQMVDDAQYLAVMALAGDLDFEGKAEYTENALKRFEVWQKGYAAFCEAGDVFWQGFGIEETGKGALYVYAAVNPPGHSLKDLKKDLLFELKSLGNLPFSEVTNYCKKEFRKDSTPENPK